MQCCAVCTTSFLVRADGAAMCGSDASFFTGQVKIAEMPREPSEIEKIGGGLWRKFQDAVNWVPEDK